MSGKIGKETRLVQDFEQVDLRIGNWLVDLELVQGGRELLAIEARPEILSKVETTVRGRTLDIRLSASVWEKLGYALATSLTRPRVRLRLEVKSLSALRVLGAARVTAPKLESDVLALSFQGAGKMEIHDLAAKTLVVDLGGASSIELAGQVTEQKVSIFGAGSYAAANLESRRTVVCLRGMGRANVWVLEELTTDIRGFGSVEVRGEPRMRRAMSARRSVPVARG